jgi:hypothetical protein
MSGAVMPDTESRQATVERILEKHRDDLWVLKWKGRRAVRADTGHYVAREFPDTPHTFSVCPLTFGAHIQEATGLPVSRTLSFSPEGRLVPASEGDALLMPLYRLVTERLERPTNEALLAATGDGGLALPELSYPGYLFEGSILRKWGKERVELFHAGNPGRALEAYRRFREEEQQLSRGLLEVMPPLLDEIDALLPGFVLCALTSGSHSPLWGGGAGNLMSWLDADVDMDVIVEAEEGEELESRLQRFLIGLGGSGPEPWGRLGVHRVIRLQRRVGELSLPLTGYVGSRLVTFRFFFTTLSQYKALRTEYMPFLLENGALLREREPGTYEELRAWGLAHYPMPPVETYLPEVAPS